MPETGYLIAAIAVCVAVTWALRALPFMALAPLRDSAVVAYLNAAMPLGIMVILVAYTLRGVAWTVPHDAVPTVLALAVTVGLHLWRRNTVLSILAGTVVYIALTTTLFPT